MCIKSWIHGFIRCMERNCLSIVFGSTSLHHIILPVCQKVLNLQQGFFLDTCYWYLWGWRTQEIHLSNIHQCNSLFFHLPPPLDCSSLKYEIWTFNNLMEWGADCGEQQEVSSLLEGTHSKVSHLLYLFCVSFPVRSQWKIIYFLTFMMPEAYPQRLEGMFPCQLKWLFIG